MTITNLCRDIETYSNDVIHHVDRREYCRAHLVLDEIEKRVRGAHRHVDHLQNVTDFASRPSGGE